MHSIVSNCLIGAPIYDKLVLICVCLSQGLTILPRMASHSQSPCLRVSMTLSLYLFIVHEFLLACMNVLNVHVWCPWRSGEGIMSSGTGVTDGFELPCGC